MYDADSYYYVLYLQMKDKTSFNDLNINDELPERLHSIIKVSRQTAEEHQIIWELNISVIINTPELDLFLKWIFEDLAKKTNKGFEIFDPQSFRAISFTEQDELKLSIKKHNNWIIYNIGADSHNLDTKVRFFTPKAKLIFILAITLVFLFFFTEFLISLLI